MSYQHSLVQHLAALNISCFNIYAVTPALSVVNKPQLMFILISRGEEKEPRRRADSRLHVSEALDAQHGCVLRGEQDVRLLVQRCDDTFRLKAGARLIF